MTEKRRKACGITVHKVLPAAAILDTIGMYVTRQYWNTPESITSLRSRIVQERCDAVAFGLTGSYWFPLCECLSSLPKTSEIFVHLPLSQQTCCSIYYLF